MTQSRKGRAAAKAEPAGRARDKGEVVPYTVEMSPAHKAALEACAEAERRNMKQVVLLALEAYFAKAGLWPPPPA